VALYNEIQIGRINRYLQKYFGIKGGPPSPQIAADVQPSVTVDLFDPSVYYLLSWETFAVSIQVAANPATNSALRLRNPIGSNVIAVIESINMFGALAGNPQIQFDTTNTDLGTPVSLTGTRLDLRCRPSPTLIGSSAVNAASTGFTPMSSNFPANGNFFFPPDDAQMLMMLPGSAWQFREGTVNQVLNCSIIWRERFLEEGERA